MHIYIIVNLVCEHFLQTQSHDFEHDMIIHGYCILPKSSHHLCTQTIQPQHFPNDRLNKDMFYDLYQKFIRTGKIYLI
jgi:hypothetical protein